MKNLCHGGKGMCTRSTYPYKMFKQATRTMILNIGYITDVKFSIVPEEDWFGQPKYGTLQKIILGCVGFCFSILRLTPPVWELSRRLQRSVQFLCLFAA